MMRRGGRLLLTVPCVTQAALCEGLRVPRVCLSLCSESSGRHRGSSPAFWPPRHRTAVWHRPPWRRVTGVSCGTSRLGDVVLLCPRRQPSPPWLGTERPVPFALSHLRPRSSRAQLPPGGENGASGHQPAQPCTGGGHCGPSSPVCVKQEGQQTACRRHRTARSGLWGLVTSSRWGSTVEK